jgi:hypothetical protein
MYTEVLSPSFVGMTFNQVIMHVLAQYKLGLTMANFLKFRNIFKFKIFQAAELCFVKLKLLMMAIETKSDEGMHFFC